MDDAGHPAARPVREPVELSVVVPMYDEEDVLPLFAARLRPVLDGMVSDGLLTDYEVLAVDDGSHDATPILLVKERRNWPQLRVVRLRAGLIAALGLALGLFGLLFLLFQLALTFFERIVGFRWHAALSNGQSSHDIPLEPIHQPDLP